MATVTRTIGTASRDYSTITLWEADLDNTGIYASGDHAVGEMYDDSAFSGNDVIDGGDTVGLGSVTLTNAVGERHDGTAGTGVRIVRSSSGSNTLSLPNVNRVYRVIGLEIDFNGHTPSNAGGGIITNNVNPNNLRPVVSHNLVHSGRGAIGTVNNIFGISIRGSGEVSNNIVYDWGAGNTNAIAYASKTTARVNRWQNNTAHDINASSAGNGFDPFGDHSNITVRNCLATACTGSSFTSLSHTSTIQSNNASSDATAPGSDSIQSIVTADQYVSTTVGSEDLRLKSEADVIDAGADLSGAGVTDDIIGTSRPQGSAYDIGAHEFLAVAAEGLVRVLGEAVGTGEQRSRLVAITRQRSDEVGVGHASLRPRSLNRLHGETNGIGEATVSVVEAIGAELLRVVSEAVAATEAMARALGLTRRRHEALGTAEAVVRLRALARWRSEMTALGETVRSAREMVRLRSEAATVSETTVTVIDAMIAAVVQVVSEVIGMAEMARRPRHRARSRGETVGLATTIVQVGGVLGAAPAAIADRARLVVRAARRLIDRAAIRFNVPPARR